VLNKLQTRGLDNKPTNQPTKETQREAADSSSERKRPFLPKFQKLLLTYLWLQISCKNVLMLFRELFRDDVVFAEQLLRFLTHKTQQILSFAIRCQYAARKYVELRLSSWKVSVKPVELSTIHIRK
jgi:hypothetical protein